jgi:hypothetical protein
MNISLVPGDWTKLRQILQRLFVTKYVAADMKRGATQEEAGAVKDELWVDTNDGFTVKIGQ